MMELVLVKEFKKNLKKKKLVFVGRRKNIKNIKIWYDGTNSDEGN